MSNENQYFDAVEYFQTRITALCGAMGIDEYTVTAERDLRAFDSHKVIIAALAGPATENTAVVNYEVTIYCQDPVEAMALLSSLAKSQTERMFESSFEGADGVTDFYDITPAYNTPQVMDRDIEMGTGHWCRVVLFASFSVIANILSIKSIKYMGEEIRFAQATTNYVVETNPYNQSGQNLMKAVATGAAFSASITMAPTATPFVTKVKRIHYGMDPKSTGLSLTFKESDELTITKTFIVTAVTSTTLKGGLPGLQVSLMEKEA